MCRFPTVRPIVPVVFLWKRCLLLDVTFQEKLLQDHIGLLRHQVEEQEVEMKEMQESFEDKCQSQKKLEDELSEAAEIIKK